MPRIYRTQKQTEAFLIREFLACLDYRILSLKLQESPDAVLTLSKGKSRQRVALEHTGYFNDTVAGQPSPLTPIDVLWKTVQYSLIRRISHRKHLTGISARVTLVGNLPTSDGPAGTIARQLAKELVDFVEDHSVSMSQHLWFSGRDFGKYAILKTYLSSLLLSRWTHGASRASRCAWICNNTATGCIGLNLSYIKTAIENKNKKAVKYNWGGANEKWLLIAASGDKVNQHAWPAAENPDWADADLVNLCQCSPFDRIVLWERVRCWYRWLKPLKPAIEYSRLKSQTISGNG